MEDDAIEEPNIYELIEQMMLEKQELMQQLQKCKEEFDNLKSKILPKATVPEENEQKV